MILTYIGKFSDLVNLFAKSINSKFKLLFSANASIVSTLRVEISSVLLLGLLVLPEFNP